jgi:hypothetical protein
MSNKSEYLALILGIPSRLVEKYSFLNTQFISANFSSVRNKMYQSLLKKMFLLRSIFIKYSVSDKTIIDGTNVGYVFYR